MIPILRTGRLTLRAPRAEDFEAMAVFLGSERARFIGGPYDRHGAWRVLASPLGHWALRGYGIWAVEETATGSYLGPVGMHDPEGWLAPKIGWWLASRHEGRGHAREAALAARRYSYRIAGWRAAFSVIAPGNSRSRAPAERLGCRIDHEDATPAGALVLVYRHPAPEDCA